MTDPTNDVLKRRFPTDSLVRDLRGRKYLSHSPLHPLDEALMERAADEIERLLRGDFTDEEFANICLNEAFRERRASNEKSDPPRSP